MAGDNDNLAGWAIIDSMMNIPLLYWAGRQTGDDRFKTIAMRHADKTLANHIRPDGSVKHIVEYNPLTGEWVKNIGGQGYSPDLRGQEGAGLGAVRFCYKLYTYRRNTVSGRGKACRALLYFGSFRYMDAALRFQSARRACYI